MKPVKVRFDIYHYGRKVGESWAVSAEKALNNFWWREIKKFDKFTQTEYKPSDFVAISAGRQSWS